MSKKKLAQFLFAPHLDPGEKIIYVAHKHPFVMVKKMLSIIFFGFILPLFLWFLFPEIWFVFLIWTMVGFIKLFELIFDWYHDALLITSVSLIDVKWHGPFDRTSNRLEYNMIEGTSYEIRGFIRTIFNYGKIAVSRNGGPAMELLDAIKPSLVERRIIEYQEKFLSQKNVKDAKTLKELLSNMLSQHAKQMEDIRVDF